MYLTSIVLSKVPMRFRTTDSDKTAYSEVENFDKPDELLPFPPKISI